MAAKDTSAVNRRCSNERRQRVALQHLYTNSVGKALRWEQRLVIGTKANILVTSAHPLSFKQTRCCA